MALALMSAATSVLGLRTRGAPAWVNWLGLALAIALLLGGLSFTFANAILTGILFASLPMLLVWVGAVSISMIKQA
jgi:hypothetical protein